ncbi:3alpha(or 20beta)-hydroxysteroid dehydrogenase [Sphingobium sp. AP50]|uniref:SDR family NAD(P)-dependent oxidoreductase n=1 Tax=Sphingobium sp. AP50 TaxID=1884369 RepID=UPI0008C420F1|nr:SDR family oxidoreductase [Sphingobium sp. AP50]SEJ66134.1 3alpha(or 20beta)-hydroxysteroid dehydrogenase [Sphingobium sp. AP50]
MGRLAGKIILITGASGGQGIAEAHAFLAEGASLILTDLRLAALEELAKALRHPERVAIAEQNVSHEPDWESVIALARTRFGGLHVLVNNAGTLSRQNIARSEVSRWDTTLAVNLTGAMLGMKHAAPLIRDSGGGSIVNVSSTAGLGAHYDAAYTASKWGLRGLTKTASAEFAEWNVRVNSIHPGQIDDTSFFRDGERSGFTEAVRRSIPLQRSGTPLDCAKLVLFLASDESSFITGAEIAIDGGSTAGGLLFLRGKLQNSLASDNFS